MFSWKCTVGKAAAPGYIKGKNRLRTCTTSPRRARYHSQGNNYSSVVFSLAVYRASMQTWHCHLIVNWIWVHSYHSSLIYEEFRLLQAAWKVDFALTAELQDCVMYSPGVISDSYLLSVKLESFPLRKKPTKSQQLSGGRTENEALFKLPAGLCWTGSLILCSGRYTGQWEAAAATRDLTRNRNHCTCLLSFIVLLAVSENKLWLISCEIRGQSINPAFFKTSY